MEVRKPLSQPDLQVSSERVPTGINSLDKIIEGGLCKGDTIVIAGQPGTGKTTLRLQFLYHRATKCGANGVYASAIESGDKRSRNAHRRGCDLRHLDRDGTLDLVSLQST